MDELSYALDIDPLDLRRRNDTMVETVTGKPYTSRSLLRCIDAGADAFGWSKRDPRPCSMQDGMNSSGGATLRPSTPVRWAPPSAVSR